MSLIGIDDAEMNNKFITVKNVLRMRVGAPTPQDAPPLVWDFLLALDAGGSIDIHAHECWKNKFEGKSITGTNHINPALLHLGIKVRTNCYIVVFITCVIYLLLPYNRHMGPSRNGVSSWPKP